MKFSTFEPMYKFLFPLLALAMYSCGAGDKKTETLSTETDSTETKDSVVTYPLSTELGELVKLFDSATGFPFKCDTALLNAANHMDSLGTSHLKMLTAKWLEHDLNNDLEYSLKQFYTIDSVKAKGAYGEWCKTLDIGNTKFANAYALYKIQIDTETFLLVWALASSSYEACPYFSGVSIYITPVYKGIVQPCLYAAESMSAGDPPVGMDRLVTGEIDTKGQLKLHVEETHDEDMDAPKVEFTLEDYWFELKEGNYVLNKEDKQKPKMVKRKS